MVTNSVEATKPMDGSYLDKRNDEVYLLLETVVLRLLENLDYFLLAEVLLHVHSTTLQEQNMRKIECVAVELRAASEGAHLLHLACLLYR